MSSLISKRKHQQDDKDFNLIKYLETLIDASSEKIRKQCKKYNLCIHKKPNRHVIDKIIANLLLNEEGSDNEDNCVTVTKPSTSSSITDSPMSSNSQLVDHILTIFPKADPNYVQKLCQGKIMEDQSVDEITTILLNGQSSDKNIDRKKLATPEKQFEMLKELLPNADPDFLRMKYDICRGNLDKIGDFLDSAMEKKDYPTIKDYHRRQQLSAQQKEYTSKFNIEKFLKIIPNPEKFFSDPTRVVCMDEASIHYANVFLRKTFCNLQAQAIQTTFKKNHYSLTKTIKMLEELSQKKKFLMKNARVVQELPANIQNIPLLQEIAYHSHKKEIQVYIAQIEKMKEIERKKALTKGLMKKCLCCYDEEVLPKDSFTCENGCIFCKSCIVKSTEITFSEGKLDFPCLQNCSSNFSLQTLQSALCPKLFSKIAQKKALEEVKSAGIENLEMCPFCDFATIPAEGYSIFTCLNPECMKESCRICKEPSHAPYKCEEIEKDEEVKARVFVESKMTEALLRKCWKCGIRFFKEEGCNKMTCSCGASMCYVCSEPLKGYGHFRDEGDQKAKCPLYSNTVALHKENVVKAAEEAKKEIGSRALRYDPAVDIEKYYEERKANIDNDDEDESEEEPLTFIWNSDSEDDLDQETEIFLQFFG